MQKQQSECGIPITLKFRKAIAPLTRFRRLVALDRGVLLRAGWGGRESNVVLNRASRRHAPGVCYGDHTLRKPGRNTLSGKSFTMCSISVKSRTTNAWMAKDTRNVAKCADLSTPSARLEY
jgi:hypothetical protein